ncbi:MAG: hypothetical protein C4551_03605 [Bacillota bacterium]|nr:MAG: hypothetical protein C4551_03605 [Bacillota bacterium]
MDGRDHVRRAIRHYLEKDEDLCEDPQDQPNLIAAINSAFVLSRAALAAARDVRDMVLRLPASSDGRPSGLHRHYEVVWSFLTNLWELIDFCELEQEVATSDVEDPVWFFGRALDQHLGGNPFEALAILDEAELGPEAADPWVQMLRAEALAATSDTTGAIKAWEEATRLDPLLIPAHIAVAGELEALGRDGDASDHWLAVVGAVARDDPIAGEARRHLARLRQRLAPRAGTATPGRYGRLPRWGPSWVPSWPGRPVGQPGGSEGQPGPSADAGVTGTGAEAEISAAAPRPGVRKVFRVGNLQSILGIEGSRARDLTVYVAGADPVGEATLRSRSAVYVGGGRLVGTGGPDADSVEAEGPDVVLLASGLSAEQCAAIADRARSGALHGPDGDTTFLYNGPPEMRESLAVIFEGLSLETVSDILPPSPGPDGVAAEDPLAPTAQAIARRVKEKLGGKTAPRTALAAGAEALAPVIEWLDGSAGRQTGRTRCYDLIVVDAQPHAIETIAVGGGRVSGATFSPAGDYRGRLLEELFEEMPKVLGTWDLALLMGRLLGEAGAARVADGPEALVAETLTGGVIHRAMLGLRQTLALDTSYGLRSRHLVVGGPLISWLPNGEHALLAAADGCQPTGVTRILLDPYGIIANLGEGLRSGRAAPDDPSLADGTAALLAGSSICVAPLVQSVKWGKPGRKLVLEARIKGAWRDGERTWELCRGEIIWVPLPAGRRVELEVRPAGPYNVGRGRGAAWRGEFIAGGLGLLLDGRGRPLRLPSDEDSRTALRAAWASEVVGKGRGV